MANCNIMPEKRLRSTCTSLRVAFAIIMTLLGAPRSVACAADDLPDKEAQQVALMGAVRNNGE